MRHAKSFLLLPPGPPKLPVIGNMHLLSGPGPHRNLWELANKYGPLMFLKLGSVSTIIVSSADVADEVMKNKEYLQTGQNLQLRRFLDTITLIIIFGKKFEDQERFRAAIKQCTSSAAGFHVGDFFPSLSFVGVISGMKAKLRKNFLELDNITDKTIGEYITKKKSNGIGNEDQRSDSRPYLKGCLSRNGPKQTGIPAFTVPFINHPISQSSPLYLSDAAGLPSLIAMNPPTASEGSTEGNESMYPSISLIETGSTGEA
ncbi:hypothetical protein SLEP1_g46191 [Rubroshorea leprosula]|uniref:Cytochrome P450 n=1 Tax=Rubroshorea leprosula TaxID=152421 RepID=A0AAV5LMD1_9ROSI|nr:hypothetical protein SLEP1_g46191 [Rubroshorea leprosula]